VGSRGLGGGGNSGRILRPSRNRVGIRCVDRRGPRGPRGYCSGPRGRTSGPPGRWVCSSVPSHPSGRSQTGILLGRNIEGPASDDRKNNCGLDTPEDFSNIETHGGRCLTSLEERVKGGKAVGTGARDVLSLSALNLPRLCWKTQDSGLGPNHVFHRIPPLVGGNNARDPTPTERRGSQASV